MNTRSMYVKPKGSFTCEADWPKSCGAFPARCDLGNGAEILCTKSCRWQLRCRTCSEKYRVCETLSVSINSSAF